MSSSRFTSLFYVLIFSLFLHSVFGAAPLFHSCSGSENFTAGGPYQMDLNKLMGYLYCKAPPTGFGVGSLGQSPNQAYALALCRGDVSTSDCETCVVEASNEILKRCPYDTGAIIWYDNCFLKYQNRDFFGRIDNQNKLIMYNLQNVSDPLAFNAKTKELMNRLVLEVLYNPKMYAAGEVELGGSEKLYGLAQCARDLSIGDCKRCLDGMVDQLPSCCNGRQGGRIVGGSCNIRYEIYPFVKA